ncbi:Protease that specifically cleaves Smt3p protein conjugates, putative [Yarrowia lipolytica]|nr:Protease that specifically cleaves Smt3p protein conjugates, putative [Yarrowia lipolytica]
MTSLYSGNLPKFDPQQPRYNGTRKTSHYDSLRKDSNSHHDDPFNPSTNRPDRVFTPNKSLVSYRDDFPRQQVQERTFSGNKGALDLPLHGSLTANQKRSYLEAFNVIGETGHSKPPPQSLYYQPEDNSLLAVQNHFDPIVDHPTMDTVKHIALEACKNLWRGTSLLFFALRASVAFAYNAVYTSDTKRRRVSNPNTNQGEFAESDARLNHYLAQNAHEEGQDVELEIIGSRQVEQYPSRVPGAFVDHQYDDYYSKAAPEQMRAAKASTSVQEPPQAHLRSSNNSYDDSLHFNGSFAASSPHFKPSKSLQDEFESIDASNQSFTPMKLPKRTAASTVAAENVLKPNRVPSYGTTFLQRPLEGPVVGQKPNKKFTERLYNAFSGNYKPPPTVVPETSFDASHLESQDRTQSVFSAWSNKSGAVDHDDEVEDARQRHAAQLYRQHQAELEQSLQEASRMDFKESYEVLEARRQQIQEQIERQKAQAEGRPVRSKKAPGAFLDLTSEQLKQVDDLWRSSPHNVIIDKFRIDLKGDDIHKLKDGRWLNDNVINFYFAMITERSKKAEGKLPVIGCMVTQFFKNLQEKGYSGVARWAKRAGIDVTKADYVFFPLNLNNNHWCLAVLDNVNKQIRQHDSLNGDGTRNLHIIKDYLRQEAEKMHPGSGGMFDEYEIVSRAESPQQFNGVDCGVFTCQNIELMARNAPLNYSQEDMPTIRRRIVYEVCTAEFLTHAQGKL